MEIFKYQIDNEKIPFDEWMEKLRDKRAKSRIQVRLDRLLLGLFGDFKSLGDGIYELRIPEGQGYRIYYGKEGDTVVILLCGGNKSSQSSDINRAKAYWKDYKGQKDESSSL